MRSNFQTEDRSQIKPRPVIVSACLLGFCCRYDGRHSLCPDLLSFIGSYPFLPFCPEQQGGLPTPRSPAGIKGGDGHDVLAGRARLITDSGADVTEAFRKGAREAFRLAKMAKATIAIMKEKSPSCGLQTPYCETPTGKGIGVTAAIFESHNIKMIELAANDVFPSPDFLKLIKNSA